MDTNVQLYWHDENCAEFFDVLGQIGDVTRYFPCIAEIFKNFQKSQYCYRDWMDKHIFINPTTNQIGLIDLERFLPKSEIPFHWKFPFVYSYKRKKEHDKLLNALGQTLYKSLHGERADR